MTIQTVRRIPHQVRAVQWLGDVAAVRALTADFTAVDKADRTDDPDASGELMAAPHWTRTLVYDGDWIVERPGGGFVRVTDEQFVADYEPVASDLSDPRRSL